LANEKQNSKMEAYPCVATEIKEFPQAERTLRRCAGVFMVTVDNRDFTDTCTCRIRGTDIIHYPATNSIAIEAVVVLLLTLKKRRLSYVCCKKCG
jgi:hypothetical protein